MNPLAPRFSLLPFILCAAPLVPATSLFAKDEPGDLEARIAEAIRRGRAALMPVVKQNTANPAGDYPMGRLALPLAAVLKAGASSEDAIVVNAFERLETMEPKKTYSVACYLFALDALWQRRFKDSLALGSRTVAVAPRKARGKVRQKIAELVNWLVEARVKGKGYWSYGPARGRSHDFSNTQFAVLGLQIGLEHGVEIPSQVFTEIANQFLRSQTLAQTAEKIRITLATTLEDLLAKTRVTSTRTYRVPPGGWSYTAGRSDPYASMTAAGTSSLQVARGGLRFAGVGLKNRIEKALASGYAWIAGHFNDYPNGNRHYYYTLYSLEKVGDLGQIEKFGEHDWYVEGARALLGRQRKDGSWGNYVDTSFALLFLTRATRLNTVAAPRIITRAQSQGDTKVDPDLIYVSRLNGFLSARAVLAMLAESRRADLVSVGEEVVSNYHLESRGDLVPPLVSLWTKKPDRVTQFARRSLAGVTGMRSTRPEEYLKWHELFARIRSLERQAKVEAAEIAGLLRETESLSLKARLIDLAHRNRLYGLLGDLLEELEKRSSPAAVDLPVYWRKIHGILVLWTGQDLPAPPDDTPAAWQDLTQRWRSWWDENKSSFAVRSRALELLSKLDRAEGAAATRLVDELAGLGEAALPFLRAEMQKGEYSFHLVEALERVTGESMGLRVDGS